MKRLLLYAFLLIVSSRVEAEDSTYIRSFLKSNDVEVYTGFYNRSFRFRHFTNDASLSQHKLLANTSAYIGFTFDYNWLSIDYAANIPNTSISNQAPTIRALGFHLRKVNHHLWFEAGTENYKGLVLPVNRRTGDFDYLSNVNYRSYTGEITYIFNPNRFSMPAVLSYSYLQAKSAGSPLLSLAPSWQRFSLSGLPGMTIEKTDSAFINLVSRKPTILSLLLNAGYTYSFVLDEGKWNISPLVWAGAGLQQQIQGRNSEGIKQVLSYSAQLNGGYNSAKFYIYLSGSYKKTSAHLSNAGWMSSHVDLSLTAGYRIGKLKRKILGLL